MKRRANSPRDARMRERLVQEAARIMAEEGITDYHLAKRKAAGRLGAADTRNLPQNREIQEALVEYQRLFGGAQRMHRLRRILETALEAMDFLERFRPRLVGAVLDGTAGEYSDLHLHVFADTPEELLLFLMDHDIPFDTDERRYRFDSDYEFRPVYRFMAGDIPVDLTLFDERGLRHPPRSKVDGQPMRRAGRDAVKDMLERLPADEAVPDA
ncbi:MAG TPA: hypothetical protein VKA32_02335 [Gammaproteobacteria bacterium]|nr:hypothetical protein [Gammaproteobacteria bacterium]